MKKPESIAYELPAKGFVRARQLIPHIVPVAHSTLWRWVKEGRFPAPKKYSPGVTAWDCEAVHAWLGANK